MDSLQLVKAISVKYPIGRCLPPILLLTLYRLSVLCNYDFESFIFMIDFFLIENMTSIQNKIQTYVFLEELTSIRYINVRLRPRSYLYTPLYSSSYQISYQSSNMQMQFILCKKCGNYMIYPLHDYCHSFEMHASCMCKKTLNE